MAELTPKAAATLNVAHHRGMAADAALRIVGNLHDEREKQILSELYNWFCTQPWDERLAIKHISAFAENRAQRMELETRSRKGAEARAKLFGAQTAND